MKQTSLLICALLIIIPNYASANTEQDAEIDRASDQAWNYYQEKKYKEARNIVSKYYAKEHVSLALLSGLLYATDNKCKEALDAMHYVSSYYDEHGVDILAGKQKATDAEKKEEVETKKAYQGLKKLGFVCHMKLEQWQETMHDARIFLQFKPDDLLALLALGNSAKQLARISMTTAEQTFERALESAEKYDGNEIEMKDHGDEALSATDYAGFNLAILYGWDGQHEKAVKVVSRLLKESKKPQKILDGMKSSNDYSSLLKDSEIIAVVKSLGLN